ncbi:hypothetical protein CR513_31411, partial [Mucuna pruriens]
MPMQHDYPLTFTPLHEKAQILHEICHTRLLKYPKEVKGWMMGANQQEWYEFHRAYGHSTEECQTLLIQEGHIGQYIQDRREKIPTSLRSTRKVSEGDLTREGRDDTRREERQRERTRSPQRKDT